MKIFTEFFALLQLLFFCPASNFAKQKDCNLARLKLCKNPINDLNTLGKVKLYALKLKQKNFSFKFDTHNSDTLADPSHQTMPVAWQNLTQNQPEYELYNYCFCSIIKV